MINTTVRSTKELLDSFLFQPGAVLRFKNDHSLVVIVKEIKITYGASPQFLYIIEVAKDREKLVPPWRKNDLESAFEINIPKYNSLWNEING